MIEHDEARLLLADLIVPGLSDPGRGAALRAHVAVCASCRQDVGELQRIDEIMSEAGPIPEPSAGLEARVLVGVNAAARRPAPTRLWSNLTALRVAAAGALTLAAAAAVVALTDGSGAGFRASASTALAGSPDWRGATGTLAVGTLRGSPAIRIELQGVPGPVAGATYQVWVGTRETRIALGMIEPDSAGHAEAVLPLPTGAVGFPGLWVTNEPDDGDPAWTRDWIVRSTA